MEINVDVVNHILATYFKKHIFVQLYFGYQNNVKSKTFLINLEVFRKILHPKIFFVKWGVPI